MNKFKSIIQNAVKGVRIVTEFIAPLLGVPVIAKGAATAEKTAAGMTTLLGIAETLQVIRAASGMSGEDAARGAGALLGQNILAEIDLLGFKVPDDKKEAFASACENAAGAFADIRFCLEKK